MNFDKIIKHIAKSAYRSSNVLDLEDLYQIGYLAVERALKTYNSALGDMSNYVTKIIKQDIYKESAKFIGVFTVDHRTTHLAAKVNDLYNKNYSIEKIASLLKIKEKLVERLLCLYKHNISIEYNNLTCEDVDYDSFISYLKENIVSYEEKMFLKNRILGNMSIKEIAEILDIELYKAYQIESILKEYVKNEL